MHEKRYDIQGLRAWAVVSVVIFHFFPKLLPYGFLGVDVIKLRSAIYSLFFATNLKPQNLEEEYFLALEKANDFFTHYWSLSVEIQFYILAPFLLHLFKVKHNLFC
ncbi:hypothetical protein PFISCL1PPCAC_11523, partial [Pristionchus fissidentatus]